jgi:hypothetical protein
MAKTQRALFENESNPNGRASGLVLVSQPNRPLTPGQRLFNRLVAQVEELRKRFVKETRKLDEALACYGEHLHPRLKRCNALRKDLIRAMAPFLDRNRLGQKRDRQTLREIIREQLDAIIQDDGSIEDADLRALFHRVHGVSYETLERREVDEVRSEMESMFEELGIDIDLSDLRPDMSPESIAAKMAEMSDSFRQKMKDSSNAFPPPGGRKSKKQLKREERMRQAEEVRKKSIASIYKQLAKALHPDLEQDETVRQRKVALMQVLTTAYHANDLHTLLRLELEWIEREEGNLERLTEEKLAIYNQVLKEQIFELKQQIAELPLHPRYQPIVEMDGPFEVRARTNGAAEARRLDSIIPAMEASLARVQSGGAYHEVRAAIREYRAANRAMASARADFDCPF